ncbi:Uncharacterised protein [Neisseria meningitidis]|nr:Uncharacterised protein [Neisseria meningitidis]
MRQTRDAREQFKLLLAKPTTSPVPPQVGFFLQIRRIGNHNAEADGKRKEICPYAATQTLESASFDQSGVNNASKPFAAPGRVSEMPTIIKNITKAAA